MKTTKKAPTIYTMFTKALTPVWTCSAKSSEHYGFDTVDDSAPAVVGLPYEGFQYTEAYRGLASNFTQIDEALNQLVRS